MHDLRRRMPGETVFGYVLLLLGLAVLAEGWRIDGLASASSASVFPVVAGAVMAASAFVTILRNRRMAPPEVPPDTTLPGEFARRITPRDVVVMAALILGYMVALEPLGFLAATFAFLLLSMLYLHRGGLVFTLMVAAGSLAAIYVVFRVVFTVVLPQGWLFR